MLEFKYAFPVTLLSLHLTAEDTNLQPFNKEGSCKTLNYWELIFGVQRFFFLVFFFLETESLGKTVI